jgi:MarR family transcriptional regulator for hemolysin
MSNSKTTPVLAPFNVSLGWALATLLRNYQKQVEVALQGLPGLGRGFLVMSLVDKETCHSQIGIAERLSLDKTTVTYLLDGLEKEALIKRTIDPNDRRSRHINLTEQGSRTLARLAQSVAKVEQDMLASLGAEDGMHFRRSLLKVAGFSAETSDKDSAHVCRAAIGADTQC